MNKIMKKYIAPQMDVKVMNTNHLLSLSEDIDTTPSTGEYGEGESFLKGDLWGEEE